MRKRNVFVAIDADGVVEFKTQLVFQCILDPEIFDTKPFVPILSDGFTYVEMIIDDAVVVKAGKAPVVISKIITNGQIAGKNGLPFDKIKIRRNGFE